ncbi:MAG: adenylate/guanylate cyclase domain-containing protein [Nannocystaceae bacterium]
MDRQRHRLPTSVPTLEAMTEDGVALCDPALHVLYANPKFIEWYPAVSLGEGLDAAIDGFPQARAIGRLKKRGYFNQEYRDEEGKGTGRPQLISLSLRALEWEGAKYILVHARDNSALVEKDVIIASHTKMIERSNRELQRKTRLLQEKNDQLVALSSKLGKYLSPQVYQSIFTGENQVKVETYRKQLTVFFSDIQGFTELTDTLEPEALANVLNHYLQEMSEIAHKYGGTLDKFIGDGILIFFGDPKSKGVKEDALAAVLMALEMRERMVELRAYWRGLGVTKPLHVRMGINSGYCTVGNFGSDKRMEYTVVGGHVNLASRLEAAASTDEILISEETFTLLEDKIECEERGAIELRGISHAVKVYSVIDYNFERLDRIKTRVEETFEGFTLSLDLAGTDRERAIHTLRKMIDVLELDMLTPKGKQGGEDGDEAGEAGDG